MAYPTRTAALTPAGVQHWRSKDLFECMRYAGFDPSAVDSDWLLFAQDLHFDAGTTPNVTTLSAVVVHELKRLSQHPPQCCIINGDILTAYSSAFGFGPGIANGTKEAGWANPSMSAFSDLAPLRVTLGNHDSAPNEEPMDAFMTAQCPWYNGPFHSWTCAGVHCIAVSLDNGGVLRGDQPAQFTAALNAISNSNDVLLVGHQPIGGRVHDSDMQGQIESRVGQMTNPFWYIGGHNHRFAESVWTLGETTLVQWQVGPTSGVTFSDDDTGPCLVAVACRAGQVVARFAWNGKTGYWLAIEQPSRAGASAMPQRLDGLGGQTPLATYLEGYYDRTGIILTPANQINPGSWRDTGSWMAYVANLEAVFPIPEGATKFFILANGGPTTLEMSDDGEDWETVSVPSFSQSISQVPIPAGLLSADDLHIRWTGGNRFIGGWGFV